DVIPNAAGIYFDFNPVIVTNTFETEFFMPLATTQFDMGNFTMFPNPAKQSVTVNAPAGGQNLAQVRLVDVTGKTLFVKDNLNSTSATLDVSSFGTGMYFMEITGENGAKATKKLMVQ
ncbi:MAG: T9SS type A sorting domain-containing protein, partial [Flavobacterium sp.]